MTERDAKVWEKFILLLSVGSFTEKEVIMEGKRQMNLFGSVAHHKKVFEEAVKQVDAETTK